MQSPERNDAGPAGAELDQAEAALNVAHITDHITAEQALEIHNRLLRNSLAYFCKHVLRMYVDEFHVHLSEAVSRSKRLAVQAARDSGKSALFSYAYAIWMAWRYPGSLGYIFSATKPLASDLLSIIKEGNRTVDPLTGEELGLFALEDVPELAWLVDRKNCIWNNDEIQLTNGSRIRARGWAKGATRGPHPLWIVCDDVLDEKVLWSQIQRLKTEDFLKTAVTNMVARGGQIIVVGTPFHEEDLYSWCAENPSYEFVKLPGLVEVYPGDPDYDGAANDNKVQLRSLIPGRYSVDEMLDRKAEIGSVAFAREILCEPISDDLTLFPSSLFVGDVMARHVKWAPTLLQCQAWGWDTYIGVDIAESAAVGADWFVATVLALDPKGNRFLIDCRRHKGLGFAEQLELIQDLNARYRPVVVYIEDNQMQRIWPRELQRTTDVPVRGFHTRASNKNSLTTGVPSLRVLLENAKLRFARGDDRAIDETDGYISELRRFGWYAGKLQGTGAHDDRVMSLWIAIEATRDATFKYVFDGQEDIGEATREVLNTENMQDKIAAAVRLILAGGEVLCAPEDWTGGLRDGLDSYVRRLSDVGRMRRVNAEIARLDDEFGVGDDDDIMLLTGS